MRIFSRLVRGFLFGGVIYVAMAAGAAVQAGWIPMTDKALPVFPRGEFWESVWATATIIGMGYAAFHAVVALDRRMFGDYR